MATPAPTPAPAPARDAPAVGRHLRLDTDSESDDGAPGARLTSARASELCPVPHRLLARRGGFRTLDDLSALSSLDYVDLSNNSLTSLAGLSGLPRLHTVLARGNQLTSAAAASALSPLRNLRVLDLADNALADVDWLPAAAFAGVLAALVLNGNRIAVLDGVRGLRALETLVVSRNAVEDAAPAAALPRLRKLSAARCALRALPPPGPALVELRVAHNKIAALPPADVLARAGRLGILDLGHNRVEDLAPLGGLQRALVQVSVAGNPAAGEGCREVLLGLCPGLEVVDGTRIRGGRRKVRLARERKEERAAKRPRWEERVARRKAPEAGTGGKEGKEDREVTRGVSRKKREVEEKDEDVLDAEAFVAPVREKLAVEKRGKAGGGEKAKAKEKTPAPAVKRASLVGLGGSSAWD